MTHLKEILNTSALNLQVLEGFISIRQHPTQPLRILNYTNKATFENNWSEEVLICRGLIIDENDYVISRGFKKFFNLGQAEGISLESANELINGGWDYELSEKMDGWLGVGYNYKGSWGVSSRGSFTSEGAIFATEKFQKIVKAGRAHVFPPNFNPIFEIIFKRGQIVIPYDYEGLVLLAVKNVENGYELPYEMVKKIWKKMNQGLDKPLCRLVEKVDKSIATAMGEDIQRKEGYVITLSHPNPDSPTAPYEPIKAKIKFDDYCRLHRILTGITGNQIHRALAHPLEEYLGGDVPPEFKHWVRTQAGEYYTKFEDIYNKVIHVSTAYKNVINSSLYSNNTNAKKAAYSWLETNCNEYKHLVLLHYDGKYRELHEAIWDSFKPVGLVKPYYQEGINE